MKDYFSDQEKGTSVLFPSITPPTLTSIKQRRHKHPNENERKKALSLADDMILQRGNSEGFTKRQRKEREKKGEYILISKYTKALAFNTDISTDTQNMEQTDMSR